MENYKLVSQWAASIKLDKAFNELMDFRAKHSWVKLTETTSFLGMLLEDLPKMLEIIKKQELLNAAYRQENYNLHEYIRVNRMADEVIIDELAKKFNIDI